MLRHFLSFLAATTALAQSPQSDWNLHGQFTTVVQGHGAFSSPYQSTNSLQSRREIRESFTTTLFLGWRPWQGGELYLNPEIGAGKGLSGVQGLAGFPNGEIYRVGNPQPTLVLARAYLRQTFGFGGEKEKVEDGPNQVAGTRDGRRLSITFGRFALNDFFDTNAYSGDPRSQFLNWALMNTAAWDYPADTKGYTWGLGFDLAWDAWSLRGGRFLVPQVANQMKLDHAIAENHGDVIEVEHRHSLAGQKGSLRAFLWENRSRQGYFQDALTAAPDAPDVTTVRGPGHPKRGWGLNFDQALAPDLGCFGRLGHADGRTEAWAFTEVDRTAALGLSLAGAAWSRPQDHIAIACIANGLSGVHQDYLAAGGMGFMLGDGALAYGPERILEVYYAVGFLGNRSNLSLDYQRAWNPGYNRDRGPATTFALRLHLEF